MQKNKQLTMREHARELKRRMGVVAGVFAIVFVICYVRAADVMDLFLKLCSDAGFTLTYISPAEMLVQSLRVCGVVAVLVSLPVLAWEVTMYCLPAFETREGRRVLGVMVLSSLLLFAVGVGVSVGVLFPYIFKYLFGYSSMFDVEGSVTVSSVLTLFLSLTWVMGLLFELPVISATLARCGVLKPKMMWRAFKPAIVVIAIIAAAITPPDVISMMMVGVPLIGDYVVAVGVCAIFSKRSQVREQATRRNAERKRDEQEER